MTNYVAEPNSVAKRGGYGALYVGYPIDGGVHLLREVSKDPDKEGKYDILATLDSEGVDNLLLELMEWRVESPAYDQ